VATYKYTGVAPELAEALQAQAAKEGRVAPRIGGSLPAGAPSLKLRGVSKRGRAALEAAGYRSPKSTAGFRIGALGDLLGVEDLDALHVERVRQAYAAIGGVGGAKGKFLAANRVLPVDVHWILPRCGSGVGVPGVNFELPDDIRDKFRPRIPDDLIHGVELREQDKPRPPWGTRPEPEPAPDVLVDVARGPELRVGLPADTIVGLLEGDDAEILGRAPELLLAAQAHAGAGAGGRELALAVVQRLARVKPGRKGSVAAVATQVVAPAIGLAATRSLGGRAWRGPEAARIARAAQPGTDAHALAIATWQQAAHADARRSLHLAKAAPGNARGARRAVARDRYARLLAGVDADGGAVSGALATQGLAALADVSRATYAALASPGRPGVMPKDAPAGLAGRVLPADPTWLVGGGGLSRLGASGAAATALLGAGVAKKLDAPPCLPLGGDMFRFDWLLREVREVGDDLAHLDDLVALLISYVDDVLDDLAAIGEEAIDRIAALVEEIRRQAEAIAAQVVRTVNDVIAAATKAATLLGVVHFLGEWRPELWIELIKAIVAAVTAGTDPVAAAMKFVDDELRNGLGSAIAPALVEFDNLAAEIETRVNAGILSNALIDELRQKLTSVLTQSGLSAAAAGNEADALLAPIRSAASDAAELLTRTVSDARTTLTTLRNTARFSAEIEGLLLAWLVAPLVALLLVAATAAVAAFWAAAPAAALVLLGTATASAVLAFGLNLLIFMGIDALRALIVRAIADLLGLSRDLAAQARAGLQVAVGQLGELQRLLATAGGLQAALDSLIGQLGRTAGELVPAEQLRSALLVARDAIRGQLDPLVFALDRAFFRETLIPGASLGDLEAVAPSEAPPVPTDDPRNIGELFDQLRLYPQLSSLVSQYESKRVAILPHVGLRQELTHVLSLLDLLGLPEATQVATAPAVRLQTLLRDTPIPNGPPLPAAGLGFVIAPGMLDRLAPGLHSQLVKDVVVQIDFEPVADEAAFAALTQQLAEAAGGTLDPALASRATGFALPGLPVVPLRFPTGVPAVLKQSCGSAVRVPPPIAAMYNGCTAGGECDTPLPPEERPPSLVNVDLLPDPNAGAQAAGWRLLKFNDGPAKLLFSHFELTRDSLRFVAEPKQLKPFENRGVFGAWELEVPALVRKFVTHNLPPVRDVRLVLSTSGQWDEDLKTQLTPPPAATTAQAPATSLPKTLDDLLKAVQSLLDAANLGNQLALGTLGGVPLPAGAGNAIVPILLEATGATLTGTPGTFTVTDVKRIDGTAVPPAKVVAVRGVRVTATSDRSLLVGVPTIPGTLSFTATGGQKKTAQIELADGIEEVALTTLGSPPSPVGVWELDLGAIPTGLVVKTLALMIFVEVAP
jgi:hypothetical protein